MSPMVPVPGAETADLAVALGLTFMFCLMVVAMLISLGDQLLVVPGRRLWSASRWFVASGAGAGATVLGTICGNWGIGAALGFCAFVCVMCWLFGESDDCCC